MAGLVSVVIINSLGLIYDIINYFFRDDINRYLLIRPLGKKYKGNLLSAFTYYKNLRKEDKALFEKRVRKFMDMKNFIPRGGIKSVTDEMKVLISASAIQLTFGLPGVYFTHFRKLLIYPDDYYSLIKRQYHKGEVNESLGIIILSWKNFLEGYARGDSGVNLGIHEMAHALQLENKIFNREYNFLNHSLLDQWEVLSREEIRKINENKESFFRAYGGENEFEFFAVALENFFERPQSFMAYHPEMYHLLTRLLKQDPLANQKQVPLPN